MDFIFVSAINKMTAGRLVVSYDIACQWHKNLRSRMASIPIKYRPDLDGRVVEYVIPKFHIGAHGTSCQSKILPELSPAHGSNGQGEYRTWLGLVESGVVEHA